MLMPNRLKGGPIKVADYTEGSRAQQRGGTTSPSWSTYDGLGTEAARTSLVALRNLRIARR